MSRLKQNSGRHVARTRSSHLALADAGGGTAADVNLEFKAIDPDRKETRARALALGARDVGAFSQRDTFFKVPDGRLKLREEGERCQLIFYERADQAHEKISRYRIVGVEDPGGMRALLRAAHGIVGEVTKVRRLLLLEDVRIHLDEVDALGSFVEVEAVVPAGLAARDFGAKVATLRRALDVHKSQLVAEAYIDLLIREDRAVA